MLKIREANLEDADTILKLENDIFGNTSDCWNKDGIIFSIKDEGYKVYVAEMEQMIIGYVITTYTSYEAYITKVAIKNNYRGNGYGEELLREIISYTDTENFVLEVRSKNTVAIKLYEKLRFKKSGLRKRMYINPVDDAIVMIRKED